MYAHANHKGGEGVLVVLASLVQQTTAESIQQPKQGQSGENQKIQTAQMQLSGLASWRDSYRNMRSCHQHSQNSSRKKARVLDSPDSIILPHAFYSIWQKSPKCKKECGWLSLEAKKCENEARKTEPTRISILE